MDENDVKTPIEVPASAVPEVVVMVVRYAVFALGAMMVRKGWISDADLNALVGGVLMAVPVIWGAVVKQRAVAKAKAMADKLPDEEARVVGR